VKPSPGTMVEGAWRPIMRAEAEERRVRDERRMAVVVGVKRILNFDRVEFAEVTVVLKYIVLCLFEMSVIDTPIIPRRARLYIPSGRL